MKTNAKPDNNSALLQLIKECDGGQTWWMSEFYEKFCSLYGLNFNEIKYNTNKIRYELNKLYNKGKLRKQITGTGYGGKGLFNSTNFTMWFLN